MRNTYINQRERKNEFPLYKTAMSGTLRFDGVFDSLLAHYSRRSEEEHQSREHGWKILWGCRKVQRHRVEISDHRQL